MSQEQTSGPRAAAESQGAAIPALFGDESAWSATPAEFDGGDGRGAAEPISGGELRGRLVPEEGEVDLDPAAAGRWLGARDRFAVRRAPKARRRVLGSGIGKRAQVSAEQRILILDSWLRSKLPAHDFSALVGVSPHTLYAWKKRFELEGPAGLEERPRGAPHGSRLPEATRRAILLLKQTHPSWGQDRIHDVLMRTRGCGASPGAIGRVLEAAGFASVDVPTTPHPPRVTTFERERPNELWQTDLFTFVLKREARRVHLVAFMDDHSRFIVGYGLHASASGALVREVFEAAIANYGAPTEVLTDNGTQYHTWRGKSDFAKLCERRGIRQIVASPRRPQTLGKIERFWGTLWRECAQEAIFRGLEDARRRIGLFIDHYNFQRTHSGIAGLVPADRYFAAADEVRETLRARVNANALDLARHGLPRKSFYLTGRVGDQAISLHAEGERVVLCREDGTREEVDLGAPGRRAVESEELELAEPVTPSAAPSDHPACVEEESDLPVPASSELDSLLDRLEAGLEPAAGAGAREGGAR